MSAKKLFISYSHADEDPYLKSLLTHLKPIERRGVVRPWFDGHILPGEDLDQKIAEALNGADIIVLLISPDFLASDYCYTTEMEAAIARHEAGTAKVIPVILRDCQWKKAPFGRLKVLPKDGRALATFSWQNADGVWTAIAEAIEAVAANASKHQSNFDQPLPTVNEGAGPSAPTPLRVKTKTAFSDQDRDDFRHASFDAIAASFQHAIDVLQAPLSGRFRKLDANRFTATIYNAGRKAAGCTVWVGGGSFTSDAIAYVGNDGGETSSMNDWLAVEVVEGALCLQPRMAFGDQKSLNLDAQGAAEYLWMKFTERLSH